MLETIKKNRILIIRSVKFSAAIWTFITILLALINFFIEQVYEFERYTLWHSIIFWLGGNIVSFLITVSIYKDRKTTTDTEN